MWNPAPFTWIQAIEAGFFAEWPSLAPELTQKHLEPVAETTKGCLRADWENVRSTKAKLDNQLNSPDTRKWQNEFCTKLIDLNGKTHSDQT